MRLGIFGGSFDPVHTGHLILAEQCRDQANLDEVWFMPAATPPHKSESALADEQRRLEMLELALYGNRAFTISHLEIERGGVSYTVDTLGDIAEQLPNATLFFLMGADSLQDFPTWREPEKILTLATPLVVRRGGEPPLDFSVLAPFCSDQRLEEIQSAEVRMPLLDISSTLIRDDLAAGRTIRYRVPRAVEQYLYTHRVYPMAEG